MQLHTITFTGADDRTSIASLRDISLEHPKVEWGILSSHHALGALSLPLLPGLDWVDRFLSVDTRRCLHLCGRLCRKFIAGDDEFIRRFGAERLGQFHRLQLNFHDGDEQLLDTPALVTMLQAHGLKDREIIVPVGRENLRAVSEMQNAGLNITVLFDESRGAGRRPDTWPAPLSNIACGYAGGLGPENIRAELGKISLVTPPDYKSWVDMEGRIRDGQNFALNKIEKCLLESAEFA